MDMVLIFYINKSWIKIFYSFIFFFLALGIYNYANGEKYEGEWVKNHREGKGNVLQ